MQITDVRLRKVNSENRMKAVASVTFDNEFVVHDIKVIESQDGLFIAMPSRKIPNGEFKDIAHPINPETRKTRTNCLILFSHNISHCITNRNYWYYWTYTYNHSKHSEKRPHLIYSYGRQSQFKIFKY